MELTAEQIDAIPAGQEMDLLIACYVLRPVPFYHEPRTCGFSSCSLCWSNCPPYSTDETTAVHVITQMHRNGWFFRVADVVEIDEFICCFHAPGMPDVLAMAKTIALAICRAALKTTILPERIFDESNLDAEPFATSVEML